MPRFYWCALEAVFTTHSDGYEKVIEAINQKYDKRFRIYENTDSKWLAESARGSESVSRNRQNRPVPEFWERISDN